MKKRMTIGIIIVGVLLLLLQVYNMYTSKPSYEDNFNYTLPNNITSVYTYSDVGFPSDGAKYDVYESPSTENLNLTSGKDETLETTFNELVSLTNIDKQYLPDFTKEYQYEIVNSNENTLICIYIDGQLYLLQNYM